MKPTTEEELKSSGRRLTELRKERGWSQKQVAGFLKVAPSTVANWELGNRTPDLATARKLGVLFHRTIEDIFFARTVSPRKVKSG